MIRAAPICRWDMLLDWPDSTCGIGHKGARIRCPLSEAHSAALPRGRGPLPGNGSRAPGPQLSLLPRRLRSKVQAVGNSSLPSRVPGLLESILGVSRGNADARESIPPGATSTGVKAELRGTAGV